ncbi:MAG: cupredoxin domain-containing protein [Gemmatimonadales bacterium]
MIGRLLTAAILAVLVGCSGKSPTGPSSGNGSGGGYGGGNTAGGTGGNTGGGYNGGTGGGTGGGTIPLTAAVTVGNIFFRSGHNGSANPATDTVAVGGTVTWTWTNAGGVPHSVQSLGPSDFTSSEIKTGDGSTYQVQFSAPGTYRYNCAVHGSMMSGTIVVR